LKKDDILQNTSFSLKLYHLYIKALYNGIWGARIFDIFEKYQNFSIFLIFRVIKPYFEENSYKIIACGFNEIFVYKQKKAYFV